MKYVAVAEIVDPAEVESECEKYDWVYEKGAIYCSIPELGFFDKNAIYCRYGLSIPYMRVKKGWKLLVEPTVRPDKRWFYTGLVDCGQDDAITPTTDDVGIIILPAGSYLIKAGDNEFKMDNDGVYIKFGTENSIEMTVAGIKINTGDATLWKPNTIPNCLFTGGPHCSITKLVGE